MAKKKAKFDLEKDRYWRNVMRQCEQSGLPKVHFCRREGIDENQFFSWQRVLRVRDRAVHKKGSQPSGQTPFIPVALKEKAPTIPKSGAEQIQIVTPVGFIIRVPATMGSEELAKLLASMTRNQC